MLSKMHHTIFLKQNRTCYTLLHRWCIPTSNKYQQTCNQELKAKWAYYDNSFEQTKVNLKKININPRKEEIKPDPVSMLISNNFGF